MRTLIRGADCVLPDETRVASVLLEDGRIADIDPAAVSVDEAVDASGLTLIPGVVDDQVHFREPGLTHKEDLHSGSVACAAGGVTTFLEMPNTDPTTTSVDALHAKLDLAAGKCVVNYGFYLGATGANTDELKRATRTPGVKIFIGSSTGPLLVDEQDALEEIFAETTLPITAHCEDESTVRANRERLLAERGGDRLRISDHSLIRDVEAARIATARAIDLSARHRHPFHVLHVSTGVECGLIRDARAAGHRITAEACPHHLFFSTDDYDRLGTRVQMNPSVKSPDNPPVIWDALRDGTIEVVATDHAPHTLDEKAADFPSSPSGLPAVENSLALMLNAAHESRCTVRQVVSWMCEAPSRIWNLKGKGRIAPGADADVVLVDLAKRRTVRDAEQRTKSGWSPWDGVELTGWPVRTWVGGRTVFAEGRVNEGVRGREVEFER